MDATRKDALADELADYRSLVEVGIGRQPDVAADADADCLFTTLGTDQPTVPVGRRTLRGDTLFVVERGPER